MIVWLTNERKEKAINFIDTLAPEIMAFFKNNNIPLDKEDK